VLLSSPIVAFLSPPNRLPPLSTNREGLHGWSGEEAQGRHGDEASERGQRGDKAPVWGSSEPPAARGLGAGMVRRRAGRGGVGALG
jgi:hypothetical protein